MLLFVKRLSIGESTWGSHEQSNATFGPGAKRIQRALQMIWLAVALKSWLKGQHAPLETLN